MIHCDAMVLRLRGLAAIERSAVSVLENIRPMIETVPLEKAADGFTRMIEGKARFRMVLVTRYGMAQAALRQAENHNPLLEGKRRRPR
jgi:hypothetical protein